LFEELHRGLIAEFTPNGRMEEETVATIARLMWRRQNLAQFEIGQLSNYMAEALQVAIQKADERTTGHFISDLKELVEARQRYDKAQGTRKVEALVEFGEVAKKATLNRLIKELDVEERLDAMIDRLIKRLLFVRGLKSITSSEVMARPSSARTSLPRTALGRGDRSGN